MASSGSGGNPSSLLIGKTWQNWTFADDEEAVSLSPSPAPSGNTSPSHSPRPPSSYTSEDIRTNEDVMKLPKKEMHIFGQCPVQDELVLVVCDTCGKSVKIEAFDQHHRFRHEREGGRRTPISSARLRTMMGQVVTTTASAVKEEPSPSKKGPLSAPFPPNKLLQGGPVLLKSDSLDKLATKEEPTIKLEDVSMDVSSSSVSEASNQSLTPSVSLDAKAAPIKMEEVDSTTPNNVISIPDTDPLPHGMSNDLMAMMGEISPETKTEEAATSSSSKPPASVLAAAAQGGTIQLSSPMIKLQLNPGESPVITNPGPNNPPLELPKVPVKPGQLVSTDPARKSISPSKKSGGKGDRKPQREYHPDKHCGVWDNDSKRNCTRALTCKSHSVLLKRKITGRSKTFDELVAAHKAEKEAAAAVAAQQAAGNPQAVVGAPTLVGSPQVRLLPSGPLSNQPKPPMLESVLNAMKNEPNTVLQNKANPQFQAPLLAGARVKVQSPAGQTWSSMNGGVKRTLHSLSGGRESDENLHYTTDHPKPLAVCTFGGRRVGGILVTDRSQYLTRKVVRVAISANGFHRIRAPNRINELKFHSTGHLKQQQRSLIEQQRQQINLLQNQQQPMQGGSQQPQIVTLPAGPNQMNYSISSPTISAIPGIKRTLSGSQVLLSPQPTVPGGLNSPRIISGVSLATLTSTGETMAVGGMPGGITVNSSGVIAGPASGGISINMAPHSDSGIATDMQDFKGGMKFELGRKIHSIVPTGGAGGSGPTG